MLTKENICLTVFLFMNFCKLHTEGIRHKGKGTFSNFPIPMYTQSDIFPVSRQTKVRLKYFMSSIVNSLI